jgi:hypothetical protein
MNGMTLQKVDLRFEEANHQDDYFPKTVSSQRRGRD